MNPAFKRRLIVLAGLILTVVFLYQKRRVFAQILSVFFLALLFTLMLAPLCKKLEQKGLQTSAAAALCIAALLALLTIVAAAFIPYLIAHSIDLIRRITPTLTGVTARLGDTLSQFGLQFQQKSSLTEVAASVMAALTSGIARTGFSFAKQAGELAFAVVIAYYLLKERIMLACHFQLLLPMDRRSSWITAALGCKNAILSYISGVLKTSAFVAGATFIGLSLLGVQDSLLLSLFMGVFEMLPYIGPVLASIPILLVTLPQGAAHAAAGLAVVILVQQIEGNFVSPYFTASSTSIHPLLALISVFVFGSLFGLWGILLAIPVVVTLRSLIWSMRQAENIMNL